MDKDGKNGLSLAKKWDDQVVGDHLSPDIHYFLAECAAKAINIPDELKEILLSSMPGSSVFSEKQLPSTIESFRNPLRSSLSKTNLALHNELKIVDDDTPYTDLLVKSKVAAPESEDDFLKNFQYVHEKLKVKLPDYELRVRNGSYTVTKFNNETGAKSDEELGQFRHAKQKIQTVLSTNVLVKLGHFIWKCFAKRGDVRRVASKKTVMQGVNLHFQPGKMYLVLGAPKSGKSILLKMIARLLVENKLATVGGDVLLNSIRAKKDIYWSNLVAYIDQTDRLHPLLTVKETFKFAWMCRSGGTHRRPTFQYDEEGIETLKKMDADLHLVNRVMGYLGLKRVENTFVGDQVRVRGVSGGEKKRVTVGEMLCCRVPVLCCDEISTGLDAATTFDITRIFGTTTKLINTVKIISLLQPTPETVANFDEIILLSEGRVIFSGPIERIIDHFDNLGYQIPDRMDLADWLQALATHDGWCYLKGANQPQAKKEDFVSQHLTPDAFHNAFYQSDLGQSILNKLNAPEKADVDDFFKNMALLKHANSSLQSLLLLVQREMLLWWRDKYFIKSKIVHTILMGIIVGTLFFQSTGNPSNVVSICFQSMSFCLVSSMILVRRQFPDRDMFYKHQDANFFPTWAYVAGRSLAGIPTALIDAVGYGSMIFWLAGLAYNDGASVGNYFVFVLLMFVTSLTAGLVFGVYSAAVKDVTMAQTYRTITAIIIVLFSGFTVQPNVIPPYYIWIYWMNCFSWLLRGFLLNQYESGAYNEPSPTPGYTVGEFTLLRFGVSQNGEPYSFLWIWWAILYSVASALLVLAVTVYCFNHIQFATGASLITDKGSDKIEALNESQFIVIPFKRANLTFNDVHYTVKASTTHEQIELLKGVDGVILAGKMTALMGSSGAGKSTLMDVLAMRKSTGKITGDIRLNGHLQQEKSFRRCIGYVEQFDTQSPQLTIQETVHFSAQMRLDDSDNAVTKDSVHKFVQQILYIMELTNLQDLQVGSGGLSFEQKKRLSIAVECAGNPSILFLDEPTSGLDAQAAATVMRGIKRIAEEGRAVCATIHQPSIPIFNEFDSLLLLKRGGEVVFFGDLGHDSVNLIQYLEGFAATPKIVPGENPATWMLTTIGAGTSSRDGMSFDYASAYSVSKLQRNCYAQIDSITSSASEENKIMFTTMYARSNFDQIKAVLLRSVKIYFRSPGYNGIRLTMSAIVALLIASVYASNRVPQNESDMNSRINSIFIALTFLNTNAMNSVLRVVEAERNMYYRHKASQMYNAQAVSIALTFAEIPFIFLSGLSFSLFFYFVMGLALEVGKFFYFLLFVTLGLGTFTFFGHMLIVLFRDSMSAQGIGGLFLTCNTLFSGVFIKPAQIPNFWIFLYWILPGHWIMEGLFMSQFDGDQQLIEATFGSPFYNALQCTSVPCYGTVEAWVDVTFANFSTANIKWAILYLVGVTFLTRIVSLYAFFNIDYRST